MGVRVQMTINDQVSDELMKLAQKSPELLSKTLFSASMGAKKIVRHNFDVQFGITRTKYRDPHRAKNKHMIDEITFRATPKTAKNPRRFVLKGPRLGSVYEYNGADIYPKRSLTDTTSSLPKVLKWRDDLGGWNSSNFVHIDPNPFFYPSMRQYVASGEYDRALQSALDRYTKEEVDL